MTDTAYTRRSGMERRKGTFMHTTLLMLLIFLTPYFLPALFLSLLTPPQDSAIVVESFKSGFDPPGDFPFEDFSQNLSRTGSDGTISSTPKGDRDRDGGPGPRPDPKHPMSKAKNKLWLFGKKPKVKYKGSRLLVSC